jgi:hypothetical protein
MDRWCIRLLWMRPKEARLQGKDPDPVRIDRNTLVRAFLFGAFSDPNDSPDMEYAMVRVRSFQIIHLVRGILSQNPRFGVFGWYHRVPPFLVLHSL